MMLMISTVPTISLPDFSNRMASCGLNRNITPVKQCTFQLVLFKETIESQLARYARHGSFAFTLIFKINIWHSSFDLLRKNIAL